MAVWLASLTVGDHGELAARPGNCLVNSPDDLVCFG